MKHSDALPRYLTRFGEPDAAIARELGRYQRCLLIPSYGEGERLLGTLRSIPPQEGLLVVVLLNSTADAPAWVHSENHNTREALQQLGAVNGLVGGSGCPTARLVRTAHYHLLCVERTADTVPLPQKQGVGLARKILADIAVALVAQGKLATPWLHMTDADAKLPEDYWQEPSDPRVAAYLHPFSHVPTAGFENAIAGYQAHLRSYALGLAAAGSPYAFHTVGSTISVHAAHYAGVRGVPRREAGEDFHFLNKLAKVGLIQQGSGNPLQLSGRPSERVPFGTGRGVRARGETCGATYDSRCYQVLGVWLRAMNEEPSEPEHFMRDALSNTGFTDPDCSAVIACLHGLKAFQAFGRTPAGLASLPRRRRWRHCHFDGLRQMQLVRRLSNTLFPLVSLDEREFAALDAADVRRIRDTPLVGVS